LYDILKIITESGEKLGADFIDVRFEKTIGTAIKVVDSKLKVGMNFNNIGVGIRSFINGSWGFVSISSVEKEKLKQKIKLAIKMAKLIDKHSKIKFELNNIPTTERKFPLKVKIKVSDIDVSEKIKFVEEIDKQARNYDNRIKNTNSIYSDRETIVQIYNSYGAKIERISSHIFCVSMNFSKEGNVRQRGYRSIGSTLGYETLQSDEAIKLGENAAKDAIELLKAKHAKGGTFAAILDPKLTGTFIHEAFGHSSEADAVIAGESILENKIGEVIGNSYLNVVDDPTINGIYGSYQVDDEGNLAQATSLVKNGILKNFLHTLETASRFNIKKSDTKDNIIGNNGRTESFHYYPIVRMSNTHILPGNWKFEEMIEDIKEGIYAQGWIRGYTDPSTGAFMFKCARANRIENGEIKELLRDIAISGNTLMTLKLIDAIGSDLEFAPGHCGKNGQTMPVSDGGPHIRVKQLVVGGLE